MARKRFSLSFDGIEQLAKKYEKLGGQLEDIAEKALLQTSDTVTPQVQSAMGSSRYNFNRTGRTKGSLVISPTVEHSGSVYSVPVGFDISHGGLPSIFLMYGTPTITPDRNLYNAIYGTKIRKQVQETQEQVFVSEIERLMNQ